MNTTESPYLPAPPAGAKDIQEVEVYLRNLDTELRRVFSNVYKDLALGKTTFQKYNSATGSLSVGQMDSGQMGVYYSAGTRSCLVYRLSDTFLSVGLFP